jgi:hypothetical protein
MYTLNPKSFLFGFKKSCSFISEDDAEYVLPFRTFLVRSNSFLGINFLLPQEDRMTSTRPRLIFAKETRGWWSVKIE